MSEQAHESMPAASVTNLGSFAFYTGMILHTLDDVAPPGFYMLKTGGSIEAIADFEALAAMLGTRYGGDGITTFGMPPAELVLAGPTAAHALWTIQGEETHTLTIAELPTHDHGGGDHLHTFARQIVALAAGAVNYLINVRDAVTNHENTDNSGAIIAAQGGGVAHNNLQPTHRVNVIVKT